MKIYLDKVKKSFVRFMYDDSSVKNNSENRIETARICLMIYAEVKHLFVLLV